MTRHVHITSETSQPNRGKAEPTNPHMHTTRIIIVMVLFGKFQAVCLFPMGNSERVRKVVVRAVGDNRLRERHREWHLVANLVVCSVRRIDICYSATDNRHGTATRGKSQTQPPTVGKSLAISWAKSRPTEPSRRADDHGDERRQQAQPSRTTTPIKASVPQVKL